MLSNQRDRPNEKRGEPNDSNVPRLLLQTVFYKFQSRHSCCKHFGRTFNWKMISRVSTNMFHRTNSFQRIYTRGLPLWRHTRIWPTNCRFFIIFQLHLTAAQKGFSWNSFWPFRASSLTKVTLWILLENFAKNEHFRVNSRKSGMRFSGCLSCSSKSGMVCINFWKSSLQLVAFGCKQRTFAKRYALVVYILYNAVCSRKLKNCVYFYRLQTEIVESSRTFDPLTLKIESPRNP